MTSVLLGLQERDERPHGRKDGEGNAEQNAGDIFEYGEGACRAAFAASAGNVAVVDCTGRLIGVNKGWMQFAHQFGGLRKIAPGANYLQACQQAMRLPERDAAAAVDGITRVLEGSILEFYLEYRCAIEPKELWFELGVHPLGRREGGAIITHMDITRCRRAEQLASRLGQNLEQINKQVVLSDFTAALAHELAQPLAAIRLNTQAVQQLLSKNQADNSPINGVLSNIVADSLLFSKLIEQLRGFLINGPPRFKALALNELIRRVAMFLSVLARKRKVRLSLQLGTALPPVWGDRVQLQQVFVNLMINAFDAVRGSPIHGREIVITTDTTEVGQVAILVRNHRPGVPKEQLPEAFEPFFTTMLPEFGTGLDLCRSIVEAHRGEISVANNSEEGVIIRVLLPAYRSRSYARAANCICGGGRRFAAEGAGTSP